MARSASRERPQGCYVNVRVTTRASTNRVVGEKDGVLAVAVAAPPVDGAANAQVIKLLAKEYDVRKSAITIVKGEKSRDKVVFVEGVTVSIRGGKGT
ncbi:MAG: DUF167 domain-containing protein [Polyangiaceae bacterium]